MIKRLTQWTLFIDMLGYKDINGSINSDASAEEFVSFMENNEKKMEATNGLNVIEFYKKDKNFNLYDYYDIDNCFVSDSLILTFKPKEIKRNISENEMISHSANALFIILIRLQKFIFECCSAKGLFLRGGVSNKYCHIKGRFAVGEGLKEAYEAESSLAKYPRILIHPEVMKNEELIREIRTLERTMYKSESVLKKDKNDGMFFLNYLGYTISTADKKSLVVKNGIKYGGIDIGEKTSEVLGYLEVHAEKIEGKIKEFKGKIEGAVDDSDRSGFESVLKKFEWLREYHNDTIKANPWLKGKLVESC